MFNVSVVGASGYSGIELVRLLNAHPEVNLNLVVSSTFKGQKVSNIYPNFKGIVELEFTALNLAEAANADLVFTALPHGASMAAVAELRKAGAKKIVDLSGDFRLPAAVYEQWYKHSHTAPELITQAVYGLSEINRAEIAQATLVANPGCYPTSVALAVIPLLRNHSIEPELIANSLSGISGDGRKASAINHFCHVNENIIAYKAGGIHQHIPEMEQSIGKATGEVIALMFTPHLAPFSRGIFSNIYARPVNKKTKTAELLAILDDYYQRERFIQVLPEGELPQIKSVAGSNYCHLGLAVDERVGQVVIFSAIDNLGKGAAGQAVQNMNIMLGLEESLGLTSAALYP